MTADCGREPAVEAATVADLAALCRIEQRVSPYPWSRREFADSLRAHQGLVLRWQRRVLGFAFFHQVLDEAELLNIAIDDRHQGRGHGARLLRHCIARLRPPLSRMHLEVRAGNHAAIALYRSNGFVAAGVRRNYYWDEHGREDALILCREFRIEAAEPAGR